MKRYLALARISAKNALRYRLTFVLSLFAVLFQFVAMMAVWHELLAGRSMNGYTWEQMRAYLLVAFASGALAGLFVDMRMAHRIRSGLVALDILKPVRYQEARFAEMLGGLWIEAGVVLMVALATVLLFGGVPRPAGPETALFVVSLALLVVLKFLVLYGCGLACFWTQNYMGVHWARIAVVNLLSGALVPLAFLPHWLRTAATWSPFAGITSTPGLILVGQLTGWRALLFVVVQAGWAIVLWVGAKALWRVAVRQLTVNGG
ncbi:ABC transporter permease [Dactylosporangium sp. NPDC048998]|uniref:ABC transporter permease n=1 Tax=Dactylosporangium sp. NPDC048998 TaxID=3363976 RepID=UPI0037178D62